MRVILMMLLGIAIGVFLSWHIAFTFHYFGATIIAFDTILGVWTVPALVGGGIGARVGAEL